jgi:methylthioribose-1-phosphate isomerase
MREDPSDGGLETAREQLALTRPTAINLRWALDAVRKRLAPLAPGERAAAAYAEAKRIADEDVEINRGIGAHGLKILRRLAKGKKPGEPVNILTHCNAGWLATVDYGTATAPIYLATEQGVPVHIYVDETRPRNQGASLTAWEFAHHGAPHTLIVDNAGGHLMQHGLIDAVIVGSDRTTANGDVCNKIGTYLKALAARDNSVPFYVALPSPTIDWTVRDGVKEIPIEERSADEVNFVQGRSDNGAITRVRIAPEGGHAANPAFDVTPARLVTGLITERGVAAASPEGLKALFPEHA